MQEALYHPEFGYYSTHIRSVGSGGDFSTSATLDKRLGSAIAAWIEAKAAELKWRRIPVIEIGAGSGALGLSVLRHLPWRTRWKIDYMIHETSPVLRKQQEQLLWWRRIRWITGLAAALKHSKGKALIFSNELVDAFPCRLFQRGAGGWDELGVTISEQGALSERIIGSLPPDPWFAQFERLPVGQRVERLDSFRDWLQEWKSHWKEGAFLTIDYGEMAEHLYEGRLQGSLRAYWRHQRFTGRDLYARFGKQDLTTDINFSDLIAWGKESGWKNTPLMTQRKFVERWLSTKKHSEKLSESSKRFSTPGDAGDAFKVLEQTPG